MDDVLNKDLLVNPHRVQGADRKIDEGKLKKACVEFESLFIGQLLKGMRRSVPDSGFLGGGLNSELYQSMFDEELSRSLAAKGGIGLGKILYQKLAQSHGKALEGTSHPARVLSPKNPGLPETQ